jgi:hypothetical protein
VEAFNNLQAWEKSMILASLQRLVALMDAGRFEGAPILTTCALEPAHETLEPALEDLSAIDLTPKLGAKRNHGKDHCKGPVQDFRPPA